MLKRLCGIVAACGLVTVAACASPGARMTDAEPAAGRGGVVLLAYIRQSDAAPRSGAVTLRKYDPETHAFLPEASDTVARFDVLPAFRMMEILRGGGLAGWTRARPEDLTVLELSPGSWAVERTLTGYSVANQSYGSTSLHPYDDTTSTEAFVVQAGRVVALPALQISSNDRLGGGGSASETPQPDTLSGIAALAALRGLTVEPASWTSVTLACPAIEYKPLELRGEVVCGPR